MAHAICCSSCKILKRGVEGAGDRDHRNPEDVSLGPEPFRSMTRQEASARAGARFTDVASLYCKQIPVRFATFTAGAHGPPWRHGAA